MESYKISIKKEQYKIPEDKINFLSKLGKKKKYPKGFFPLSLTKRNFKRNRKGTQVYTILLLE